MLIYMQQEGNDDYIVLTQSGVSIGTFVVNDDGYYVYFPVNKPGYYTQANLEELSRKLKELNHVWHNTVINDECISPRHRSNNLE